jgi:hypothetical protein
LGCRHAISADCFPDAAGNRAHKPSFTQDTFVCLIERCHNERFMGIMDEQMPRWRTYRAELNAAPWAYENWDY